MPVKVQNKKSPAPKDAPVETKPVEVVAPVETKPVEVTGGAKVTKSKVKAAKAEAAPVEAPKVEAPKVEAAPVEATGGAKPKAAKGKAAAKPTAAKPKAAKGKVAAKPKADAKPAKPAKTAKTAKAAKPKVAKAAKGKAVTETADEHSEELEGGKRSFKAMLPGSDKFEGRYTGLTPYQAANKALSKYYRESTSSASEITFSIRESTRGSKRTVYTYNGRREKLATPVEYTIKGKDGERTVVKEYKNRLTKVKKADVETATVTTEA